MIFSEKIGAIIQGKVELIMNQAVSVHRETPAAFVAGATIACAIVLSALFAPLPVSAASSGSLVRGSLPAVYYVGVDGRRYVFPNEKTYATWYSDFESVAILSDADLASLPIGGNVTYKPGVRMVKIQTDPKVYVVDSGGTLRAIPNEATAAALYGVNWNQYVDDVPDAFFVSYVLGVDLSDASDFDPAAVSAAATSINDDKNLAGGGVITVTLAPDDTDTEAGHVVGGTSNVVLAKYKFTAQNEELALKKVRLSVDTAVTVSSLTLYDGSTLVGGPVAITGSGTADFSGLNFVIPKDSSKVLTVKGNLNAVGAGGASSGAAATITLWDGDGGTGSNDGTFEVRGTATGSSTLIQNSDGTTSVNGSIIARMKIVRKSKPTVALVSLPSSVLTPGTIVVGRFSVTADAAGDVALKAITASMTSSSSNALTISAPALRRVGDGSDLATTGAAVSGTCTAVANACVANILLATEEVITAGTTRTFDLRINLAGTLASGDSLSTTILGDTATETGAITAVGAVVSVSDGGDATTYNFVWSDISVIPHNDTIGSSSSDWTSGLYVKVLPTDAQTMSK